MSLKIEFVEKSLRRGARMSALCREYGISRETGYKWRARFRPASHDLLRPRRFGASPENVNNREGQEG